MPDKTAPFVVTFDLARLSDAGREISLAPTAEQRAELAHWAGISSFESLKGKVRLEKLGGGYFGYEAEFAAELVQACVVTLEPVRAKIAGEFGRSFHVAEKARHTPAKKREIIVPSPAVIESDDEPEELSSSVLDIAGPVLEELALAIDPYPRKPGVAFQPPADEDGKSENPFAVLKKLKTKS
jgi:uncharacterized metal-binding protein YceD (DUF177 family)